MEINVTLHKRLGDRMIWFIVVILAFGLDQISKRVVESKVNYGEFNPVIDNFFYISHHRNTGAAWSFLSEYSWSRYVFISLTIVVSIIMIYLMIKSTNKFLSLTLSLIIGGAFGNLIDRILKGYVTDFFEFHFGSYQFPIFNVADMCVVIGTILLAIYLLFIYKEPRKY